MATINKHYHVYKDNLPVSPTFLLQVLHRFLFLALPGLALPSASPPLAMGDPSLEDATAAPASDFTIIDTVGVAVSTLGVVSGTTADAGPTGAGEPGADRTDCATAGAEEVGLARSVELSLGVDCFLLTKSL